MSRWVFLMFSLMLGAVVAFAGEHDGDAVPSTVHGGNQRIKEGGREMGEGFLGIGRGVKKTFKGERSKEDFEEAEKIGTGVVDVGKGVAGVGRGVGNDIKDGVSGGEESDR